VATTAADVSVLSAQPSLLLLLLLLLLRHNFNCFQRRSRVDKLTDSSNFTMKMLTFIKTAQNHFSSHNVL